MRLGDATWREVADASGPERAVDGVKTPIVLIPVGSTEQHGPHLPLATDTWIAEELAGRAIHQTDGLMVGPTISVSASGEHAGFAGTLSIGLEVMTMVVVELVRSADWAAGVVLVNGHGGNHRATCHDAEHHAQPHELVTVEVEEDDEKGNDGQQPDHGGSDGDECHRAYRAT